MCHKAFLHLFSVTAIEIDWPACENILSVYFFRHKIGEPSEWIAVWSPFSLMMYLVPLNYGKFNQFIPP